LVFQRAAFMPLMQTLVRHFWFFQVFTWSWSTACPFFSIRLCRYLIHPQIMILSLKPQPRCDYNFHNYPNGGSVRTCTPTLLPAIKICQIDGCLCHTILNFDYDPQRGRCKLVGITSTNRSIICAGASELVLFSYEPINLFPVLIGQFKFQFQHGFPLTPYQQTQG